MVISLVLPCYNPPRDWEHIIHGQYTAFQKKVAEQVELVVVLDGTSGHIKDEDCKYLEQHIPSVKLISYPVNRGKGYAIRQGVSAATGDIILYTDVDFPYTIESMLAVYEPLRSNECDVAVGVKNDTYYAQVPFMRRLISKYLRFLISVLLSMPITDTQCGLKGFKRAVAPVFLKTTIDRYLFDLEFLKKCFKSRQWRVKAIQVTLNEDVHFRKMNYQILLPEMANFLKLLINKGNE